MTSADKSSFNFQFWDFFEQFAFVNNHLLCCWPTIHHLILEICPKLQLFFFFEFSSSQFLLFQVNELLDKHLTKIVQSENISTPNYVEVIRCIDQRFASRIQVLVYSAWPWYSTWAIQDQKSITQKRFQVSRNDKSYPAFFRRLIQTHGSVVKAVTLAVSSESGNLGSILGGSWNSLLPFGHFAGSGHWASQCIDMCSFTLLCSVTFLSWNSSILPSYFRCFGELELWPGPALAHICWPGTWAEIIAIAEPPQPRSWLTARSVASFFPDFSKIQKKGRHGQKLTPLHAQHWFTSSWQKPITVKGWNFHVQKSCNMA